MKFMNCYHRYKEICEYDDHFVAATRNINSPVRMKQSRKNPERKFVKALRFSQAFSGTFLSKLGGVY